MKRAVAAQDEPVGQFVAELRNALLPMAHALDLSDPDEARARIRAGVERLSALARRAAAEQLRAPDGVDAGTYVASEPLTVAVVRARVGGGFGGWSIAEGEAACLTLYRDVLQTIGADRGPLGDLARAALEAEAPGAQAVDVPSPPITSYKLPWCPVHDAEIRGFAYTESGTGECHFCGKTRDRHAGARGAVTVTP